MSNRKGCAGCVIPGIGRIQAEPAEMLTNRRESGQPSRLWRWSEVIALQGDLAALEQTTDREEGCAENINATVSDMSGFVIARALGEENIYRSVMMIHMTEVAIPCLLSIFTT